ncbi:galectin-8-like, partial [Syngnathus typhle]|uniref:galectin-8-like n=1 Tax=Syngnathus typhle TaxID=161592 RepID=UPI002A6B4CB3
RLGTTGLTCPPQGIPYTGSIPGGLHPGEIIIIQGTVLSNADRFQIDLSCGGSTKPPSDVALHFSAHFKGSPCVRCNSLLQESWGQEETLQPLPYKRGAPFKTIILVHKDTFKVAVNGAHLLEYKHRIPLNRINTFSVSGKVQEQAIGYILNSAIYSESSDLEERELVFFPFSPGEYFEVNYTVVFLEK